MAVYVRPVVNLGHAAIDYDCLATNFQGQVVKKLCFTIWHKLVSLVDTECFLNVLPGYEFRSHASLRILDGTAAFPDAFLANGGCVGRGFVDFRLQDQATIDNNKI